MRLTNLEERFEALLAEPLAIGGLGEQGRVDGEQDRTLQVAVSHVGAIDLGTAEGQFALGLWAGNQVLAALCAPVKRDR